MANQGSVCPLVYLSTIDPKRFIHLPPSSIVQYITIVRQAVQYITIVRQTDKLHKNVEEILH